MSLRHTIGRSVHTEWIRVFDTEDRGDQVHADRGSPDHLQIQPEQGERPGLTPVRPGDRVWGGGHYFDHYCLFDLHTRYSKVSSGYQVWVFMMH